MPATLATLDPYLKDVYVGEIRRQLNDEITTLKRITRSDKNISTTHEGKYVTFPIHTRRNSGIGSRAENAALPNPGQQGYAAARVQLKHGYGALELTGQAIELASEDREAFASSIEEEQTRLKDDLRKDMNRQIYGNGTGAISTVASNGTGVNNVTVADARLFQIDEVVDIITAPATVAVSARTITAINTSTNVITLSGATFNVSVGQLVVRTGNVNQEVTGFGAIVSDTGVLYNVNPTTEPQWKAVVNANGGTPRALTEGLMIRLVDDIRTNGGKTTVIFQSLGVRRSYFNLLSQLRQVVNTQEFTGGFKGLAFTTESGEIPVVADVDAPLNTQWFINEDELTWNRDKEWDWLNRDGNMWKMTTDANGWYDKWRAYLVERHELSTGRRNTHGKLADLIES